MSEQPLSQFEMEKLQSDMALCVSGQCGAVLYRAVKALYDSHEYFRKAVAHANWQHQCPFCHFGMPHKDGCAFVAARSLNA